MTVQAARKNLTRATLGSPSVYPATRPALRHNRVVDSINSLENFPAPRCPLAPENEEADEEISTPHR